MKKQFRVAVVADLPHIDYITQVMKLAFGQENVLASFSPEDLIPILKQLRPHALIITPDLFDRKGIQLPDIVEYRKEMKYRIVTLYLTENDLCLRNKFTKLRPDKEYIFPTEYLTIVQDIKKICTNTYTKRKHPLKEKTALRLREIFQTCNFRCDMKGAAFLQEALLLLYFDPSLHNTGGGAEIYRNLAADHKTTPRIIERSIQRFLETSWVPATEKALRKELAIPEFYSFVPINFGRFTELFNTYFTIKYGDPKQILTKK
ncbi:MAG: hypothetical protein IJC19_03785 [Clostridia bacterium]|nr:hypothetical protein [Clostridia bacterium]